MGKQRLRKKIKGLNNQIRLHVVKIKRERLKSTPDEGMISHWKIEIATFEKSIEKAMKRLNK